MTTLREAAQQALEAMERSNKRYGFHTDYIASAITALRAALEQPEPWVKSYCNGKPNYTTPEQAEPVTNNPDPYHLSRILHELAGSASMCWEHVDRAGVFQSTQAADVVAAAIAEIRQRMKDAPPQRKPLTEEEIAAITDEHWPDFVAFTRAVEAAHGIKE